MLNRRSDKVELLRIADAVAKEKSIDKETILSSMELAIQKAAKTKFGSENDISVKIDRESGDITLHKVLTIVEKLENFSNEISLENAKKIESKEDIKIGDKIYEQLPPVDFGRIAAQTARQVITQNVRAAERERQYNDFIDKKGEILSGIVKRLEYGNAIIDLNRSEAIIRKEELIPREVLKTGDRIKAYCYDVIRENKGQQIFYQELNQSLWKNCFFKRYRKFMMELLKLNHPLEILEVEQKLPFLQKILLLIQLEHVLAWEEAGFSPWLMSLMEKNRYS